jgi:hypothetical protein
MTASKVRVLRVTGIPPEMALRAIDALLRTERSVVSIDAVELEPEPERTDRHAVHVVTEEDAVERIRRKLTIGFPPIDIEDVTETNAAGRAPTERIRATAYSPPPKVGLDPQPVAGVRQPSRRRPRS